MPSLGDARDHVIVLRVDDEIDVFITVLFKRVANICSDDLGVPGLAGVVHVVEEGAANLAVGAVAAADVVAGDLALVTVVCFDVHPG